MARHRMWVPETWHLLLVCDFIEVSSKNNEVVFNLVALEGEEVYIPVGPGIFTHNLSCFIVT